MSVSVKVNDSALSDTSAISGSSSVTGSSAADLQGSFLTLLVAQLKNQDPTNPMQNNELTTQLAQINTVSGIEKLNTTLGSITGQLTNNQSVQASTLIGHGVLIPGDKVLVGNKTTTPFGVELIQGADKVTATLSDKEGKVVRTLDIGALSAGVHTFSWDGNLDDGSAADEGAYTLTVSASSGGSPLVTQPLNFAMVNGVVRDGSSVLLDLGTYGNSSLDEIRQII